MTSPTSKQTLAEVRPDEPCSIGNQHAFHCPTSLDKGINLIARWHAPHRKLATGELFLEEYRYI